MPVTAPVPGALSQACAAVRPADEADAVAGVTPSWVARPASTLELSAVLRAAAGLNLASVPRGTGTKLAWGRPPDRCDLVVDMLGLDQVLEHEAGDLVARVQAGIRISELAAVLGRPARSWPWTCPPRRPAATVTVTAAPVARSAGCWPPGWPGRGGCASARHAT